MVPDDACLICALDTEDKDDIFTCCCCQGKSHVDCLEALSILPANPDDIDQYVCEECTDLYAHFGIRTTRKGPLPCCNKRVDKPRQEDIRCQYCSTWYHSDCLNLTPSIYEEWYCDACSGDSTKKVRRVLKSSKAPKQPPPAQKNVADLKLLYKKLYPNSKPLSDWKKSDWQKVLLEKYTAPGFEKVVDNVSTVPQLRQILQVLYKTDKKNQENFDNLTFTSLSKTYKELNLKLVGVRKERKKKKSAQMDHFKETKTTKSITVPIDKWSNQEWLRKVKFLPQWTTWITLNADFEQGVYWHYCSEGAKFLTKTPVVPTGKEKICRSVQEAADFVQLQKRAVLDSAV